MIKKINILVLLLLVLLSISAVSAYDDTNLTDETNSDLLVMSDNSIDVTDDVYSVSNDDELKSNSHKITQGDYGKYFSVKDGKLVESTVESGDTIYLDGSLSNLNFIFTKPVNIVGTSTNNMKNSVITLLSGASGSTVSGLHISNTEDEKSGILLNSASNCLIKDCVIKNTGRSSYPISVINGANYNNVTGNDLKSYGITYGHGTRSTPGLIVSGSNYNYIANNKVEVDDANGIYLSSYSGGINKGGISNFNIIYNNTVKCNEDILPTSWSWLIQIMGNNNTIDSNTVIRGYRGISTSGDGNVITGNTVINLTGADYTHLGVETGGDYSIVGAYNSTIVNNVVIGAKTISTGAGISAIDGSIVENNRIEVLKTGRGINAGGSNVIIRNNTVSTVSGSGVYEKDEGSGLLVENNNITSASGVGILIEQLSSRRMPSNVTIIGNTIKTGNKVAIDAKGVLESTSNIDITSNVVYGKEINTPAGVIDTSKPTYIFKGKTIIITPSNIREYINDNGGLTSEVDGGDILNFEGTFNNEIIYVTKNIKITGKNPVFYNSTFKVTSGNVLIENLTIINKDANRVNAWGIFTNQAPGVRITNNKISVSDSKASYAVYVLESTDVEVSNNILSSEGEFLTFTLLSYASENCTFENNTIKTTGTGEVYSFSPEKCIDGNELVIDGKSYCIDGNELVIDGKSYCIDGDELVIDGKSYCIDGEELVIDGKSYCIDGNELIIDGKTYCVDGNELVIDGKSYGSEYSTGNAHVVSEIYQTYGILLLYSSNNKVSGNDVNVTSNLASVHATTGADNSTNSLVGIDLYFNTHNNVISNNTVSIKAKDNYIYGMGVLGYKTGHTAPDGQGATNNIFDGNKITLEGPYFTTGMIAGSSSEQTVLKNNIINLKSAVGYGITLEMSQKSTIEHNGINIDSEVVYGIDSISSSDNTISNNSVTGNGKQVYGMLLSNSNNNVIDDNFVKANGNGEKLTFKNLDSLGYGNAGIYLKDNSTNNKVENNNITSSKGYSSLIDDEAISNTVSNNYLVSEKGMGDAAISSKGNNISDNYIYESKVLSTNVSPVSYGGIGEFTVTVDKAMNGATVRFYDADGKEFSKTTVSNGIANAKYQFDDSYVPAQYLFTAEISKVNYKTLNAEFKFNVDNGNAKIIVDKVSIAQGDSGNIVAKVVDEFGNPIKGVKVQFSRVNTASRANPIGEAKSDENGTAKLSYVVDKSLTVGDYNLVAKISGEEYYNDAENVSVLTVMEKVSISGAKAYSVYYGNTVKFKVKISDANTKKALSAKTVKFVINGKTKNAVTDKNGYATYSVKLSTGSYTISAECNGVKVSKKITFKPTVITKNLSKKKAKTIKFTAKLVNKNGKILKNKKITFKIKNKKYTAKTNKKGIATLSLKNLKVGKYTITSSYGGCNIKNTIKIKK